MHPAFQMSDCSDDNLRFARQCGVEHIVVASHRPFIPEGERFWQAQALREFRERVESHGVEIAVMAPPLHSNFIDSADNPDIMLAGPERDRQIDDICKCVQAAGEAGIVRMLEILEEEVRSCLGLLGVTSFEELDSSCVQRVMPLERSGWRSAFPLLDEGY